jgi:hypothetical protein
MTGLLSRDCTLRPGNAVERPAATASLLVRKDAQEPARSAASSLRDLMPSFGKIR